MNEKDVKTPFLDALINYTEENNSSFDVPGHHLGNVDNKMTRFVGKKVYQADCNAPVGLDNLAHPNGVLKESMDLMAKACNADHAFFLINGTSSGLQAAILTYCQPNDKIILPRNVHKSVANALVLSGAIPIYVTPDIDTNIEIANQPSVEAYKKAIIRYPSAKMVIVINPTYFGVITDLQEIVTFAHQRNMIVLADEAHGAHYYFCKDNPISAMDADADISAVSFHKTGGSLTQSSALLLKGDRVDPLKMQITLNMLNTTSPSSLLLGSLDAARAYMEVNGEETMRRLKELSQYAFEKINEIPGFIVRGEDYFKSRGAFGYDRTKLLIEIDRLDLHGFEIYRLLKNRFHVQIELAESYVILCVLALGNTKKHVDALVKALKTISKEHFKKNLSYPTHSFKFDFSYMLIRPRTAFFAPTKTVPLEESLNHISKESIVIYPPGIPLILPGEVFTKDTINQIKDGLKKECTLLSNHPKAEYVDIIDEHRWKRFTFYKKRLDDFVLSQKTTPRGDGYLLPAEWEEHQGTIILLPYRKDVWRHKGKEATEEFKNLITAVAKFEPVYVGVHPSIYSKSIEWLEKIDNVIPLKIKYNDSWARDNTLIFVKNKKEEIRSVDFRFNAWGGEVDGLYSNYSDDDLLGNALTKKLNIDSYRHPFFVLEGGSILTDGEGTLITTEACLLSKGRNPQLTKEEIEETLKIYLGVSEVIWLPHGIIGDETNEHIDNFVSFARPGVVLLSWPNSNDKVQYAAANKALKILENSLDAKGRKLQVIKVKMPEPIYLTKEESKGISPSKYNAKPRLEGDNLLASYINYYQGKDFVILPCFGVKEDAIALKQFQEIYPDKEVIQIKSKEILIGGGNIHCVTMQIPKGKK